MPEQAKGIHVHLVKHESTSLFPEYSVSLGNISAQEYAQIKTVFATANREQSTCMRNINVNYHESMIFGIIDKATHFRNLEISGMSWMAPDKTLLCQDCTDKPDREKMNICAQNMRNGKCRDTLVRRTFGATLFPQFYAQEKQR